MSDLSELMLNSLLSSVKDCFSTTLSINLTDSNDVKQPNPENCLICSIGFTGKIEGSVAVVILDKSACKIVGQMLSMEFAELDGDVKDGMGEICNMIAGGVKNRLSTAGHPCEITVPTAIIGRNLEISFPKDVTQFSRRFTSEGILLDVFIDFKIHQPKAAEVTVEGSMKEAALARFRNLVNTNLSKT